MLSDGWVEDRDRLVDRGEARTVDEPEDEERESVLNGSEKVGVGDSAMSHWFIPPEILVLFGKPNPKPTEGPSRWLDFAHCALLRFPLGVAAGNPSEDSIIAAKCRDEGLGGTRGEAGTVASEGVELIEPDVRLVVVEGVRYPSDG